MLTVSIIVHGDYTHIHQALKSLFQNMNLPLTVYVTINTGSSPEATELQSAFPQALYLINEPPRGFAANHNRILRLAQTRYVALLNDDVEIPPDMINCLVTYLEDHPRMGLVTPLVQNPDKTPQLTTFSDPSLLRMIYKISGLGYLTRQGSGIRNFVIRSGISRFLGVSSLNVATESREVPVAVGVAMFVRRQAYEQAGVIDEDTRFYGEEFGWQWRLRQVGWKIAVVTDTYIIYRAGGWPSIVKAC